MTRAEIYTDPHEPGIYKIRMFRPAGDCMIVTFDGLNADQEAQAYFKWKLENDPTFVPLVRD